MRYRHALAGRATVRASLIGLLLLASLPGVLGARVLTVSAAATIVVSNSATANVINAQWSTNNVFAGAVDGSPMPPSGIAPLQRLQTLNPPAFRIHSGSGGGALAAGIVFPADYTSTDQQTMRAWDFSRLDSLILDGSGTTESVLMNVPYAPDNLFSGSGPLGGNGSAQGALLDQSYVAYANYMAALVAYFNTVIPVASSGANVTYTATTLTDTSVDLSAYGAGFSITATKVDASTKVITPVTSAITSVAGPHTVNVSAWPGGPPANGSPFNLALTTPPITAPRFATPWPRPPGVGPLKLWEIWNEPDFSSENPRIPPILPPPSGVTLTATTGGILAPGTYTYRVSSVTSTWQEGLASAPQSVVVSPPNNAVRVSWGQATNLSRVAAGYKIYGRHATTRYISAIGDSAPSGRVYIDTGATIDDGTLPGQDPPLTQDQSGGGPPLSPLDYRQMWDKVVPAMKAVDPTIQVIGPVITNPLSIGSASVLRTAGQTTDPTDNSWFITQDYVQVLAGAANAPDAYSVHTYGGGEGSLDSTASLMTRVDGIITDLKANVVPYIGTKDLYLTEVATNASPDTSLRPATAMGAAWFARFYARLVQAIPNLKVINQYQIAQDPNQGMIVESGSPVHGVSPGDPYIDYWVMLLINQLFLPGSRALHVAGAPAGVDVLAVAQPPDFSQVKIVAVNDGVPARNINLNMLLTGPSVSKARLRVIDSNTSSVTGPHTVSMGPTGSVNIALNGFSVAFLEVDTPTPNRTPTPTPSPGAVNPSQSSQTGPSGTRAGG